MQDNTYAQIVALTFAEIATWCFETRPFSLDSIDTGSALAGCPPELVPAKFGGRRLPHPASSLHLRAPTTSYVQVSTRLTTRPDATAAIYQHCYLRGATLSAGTSRRHLSSRDFHQLSVVTTARSPVVTSASPPVVASASSSAASHMLDPPMVPS